MQVNEHAVSGFPGASVSTGRTGQTGGGTNPQLIPPEEGGEGKHGTSSAIYEDARGYVVKTLSPLPNYYR